MRNGLVEQSQPSVFDGHTRTRYVESELAVYSTYGLDEEEFTIADIARNPRKKFLYFYDSFGDNWRHGIVVEKILKPDPDFKFFVCLDGAMECPP